MEEELDQLQQLERILNEKFLTLVVKKNGSCQIGFLSKKERDVEDPVMGWSTILIDGELISVIYTDDYRIPKRSPNQSDKQNQKHFWQTNKRLFNYKASRIANSMDMEHTNCIVGDCAFVFESPTAFNEARLQKLAQKEWK